MNRRRIAAFVVIVVIILGAYALRGIHRSRRDSRVRFMQSQLSSFTVALRMYACLSEEFPGRTYGDAVAAMLKEPVIAEALRGMCSEPILNGRDVWGHTLVYSVSDDGQSALIRSYGPNGRDDAGKADDIQYIENP